MPKPKSRPAKATTKAPTPISLIKFEKEKRVNIPTEELRDFVTEEEKAPKTVLYPRDPSLDPQLVWRGKDEQDQKPLEVLTVPPINNDRCFGRWAFVEVGDRGQVEARAAEKADTGNKAVPAKNRRK